MPDQVLVVETGSIIFYSNDVGERYNSVAIFVRIHPNMMRNASGKRIQLVFAVDVPVGKKRPAGKKAKNGISGIKREGCGWRDVNGLSIPGRGIGNVQQLVSGGSIAGTIPTHCYHRVAGSWPEHR